MIDGRSVRKPGNGVGEERADLTDQRDVSCAADFPEIHEMPHLPAEISVGPAERREPRGARGDLVYSDQGIDHVVTDAGALVGVVDRGRQPGVERDAAAERHQVERHAEDGRVVADGEYSWDPGPARWRPATIVLSRSMSCADGGSGGGGGRRSTNCSRRARRDRSGWSARRRAVPPGPGPSRSPACRRTPRRRRGRAARRYSKLQASPARYASRILRDTTVRCTSSGPS